MSRRCSVIQRLWDGFCAFFKAEDFFLCNFKGCIASPLPSRYETTVVSIPLTMLRRKSFQALTPRTAILKKRYVRLFPTRSQYIEWLWLEGNKKLKYKAWAMILLAMDKNTSFWKIHIAKGHMKINMRLRESLWLQLWRTMARAARNPISDYLWSLKSSRYLKYSWEGLLCICLHHLQKAHHWLQNHTGFIHICSGNAHQSSIITYAAHPYELPQGLTALWDYHKLNNQRTSNCKGFINTTCWLSFLR